MYNLVIIQTSNNGTTARAIYPYEDWDTVLAAFHSELAYRADTRVKTVCTILDENGTELKNEIWERKVEE